MHNFIIDEREAKGFHEEDASFFREFSLREQDSRRNESAEIPSAVATDNNQPHPGGCQQSMEFNELQNGGECVRMGITQTLYGRNLGRPVTKDMLFNNEGQVYFTATE